MNHIPRIVLIAFLSLQSIFLASAQDQDLDTVFDTSSRTFLPIPLIINNPTFDTGIGAIGMYFFKFNKEDKVSPPSIVSLLGLYSTNDSYVFVAAGRLFWGEDKNRATFLTGPTRINFDFNYEIDDDEDVHLVYSELRNIYTAEYSRKIIGDFYLGVLYLGTKTTYRFDQGTDEENEFAQEFFEEHGITDNFISSLGLNFSFDNQDYIYNPTKGLAFSIRPKFNTEWLGSDNEYVDTDFNFTYFTPISERDVLGFSLAGGLGFGDVPFDGYQTYGARNNLRGYESGKYRGQHMVALQTEYRKHIYRRWGAVAFAGTGSIWNDESNDEGILERIWLPSLGIGARYMISLEKRINLRLDYAVGVDGNQGVYFGIMESF